MSDFQQIQSQFAAAIRDPAQPLLPGVSPERMAVYQELFFNNVLNFVSSAFPVLSTLYREPQWHAKTRLFFQSSNLHSPYFLDIAESFLNWLQQQQLAPEDPPFLLELAHYEWIELYLATAHRQCHQPLLMQTEAQLATSQLAMDELALLLCYQYPVSQISATFRPERPAAPSLLLVYRDLENEIKFMALNQLSASLLQLLINTPGARLAELTTSLQTLAPQLTNQQIGEGALQLLQDLAKKGVIRAFQAA
ncbi:DUF2063 domain-containing protein [Rheinheimera riviphila]|uniref:DUF2063 domain-containing protein n=1 Tax=Rheinheimera riviphila TaxID=1834037 RepID=A0A437R1A6_9GAMM|nr:putative DNA-binding domain-containing protein [Rheinheimera riviphila]RVU40511.1 DUF2063 domain-containing protein [Rheinheimera riviphila]